MTTHDPEPQQTSRPPRRWLRRVGIGLTALIVIVVALVGLLQLPPVATLVVRKLLTLAPLNPGNRLEVARVSGNFLRGLVLEDLRLRQDGRDLGRIDRLAVGYRLSRLRPPGSRLDSLTVVGGSVTMRRRGGRWDLMDVVRKSADTTSGGGRFGIDRLLVRDVAVAAQLAPDSVAHVRMQELAARDLTLGETVLVTIDRLLFAVRAPLSDHWLAVTTRGGVTAEELRLDPLRVHSEASDLTGRIVVPWSLREPRLVDRLDVRLAARPLALADLAGLVPVPPKGELVLDARAEGEGDLVTAHLAATLDRGRLTLDAGTRLHGGKPTATRVQGRIARLDPSRLHTSAPTGEVNARLDAETNGPLSSADGSVRLDLGGTRLGSVVVRRFELGALLTEGTADLTLRGALDSGRVSATGRARLFDSIPSYRLSGSAVGMPGTAAVARTLTGPDGNPALAVGFRISGEGASPDSASVRGRVDLAAVRDTGARRPLGSTTLRLADGRLHIRPEILAGGGSITAVGRVTLGDTLAYELRDGRIDRVDLGALAGDTIAAPLSGRFTLTGRGTAPAEARISAGLHLDELRYGARRMEQVDAVARLERGQLRLSGQGALQGGRLILELLGRPFDSTASYVLRRAALEGVDLGTFLGQPQLAGPVTLSVTGEARLRGTERVVRGQLTFQPSRLGHVKITEGTANLRLAGQALTYDASLRTNGGALSAAGDGTPGAPAPVYRIREGRLSGIDLGALLSRSDLHTDLNTTFTADVTRVSPDSMRATLGVNLLPSRINQAELTSGSVDARVDGRQAQARLRADGPDATLDATVRSGPARDRTAVAAEGGLRVEHLARWTGRADADGRLESHFALTVETDSAGPRSVGGTVNAVGGIGGIRVPALSAVLSPVDGQLQLDTLLLRSNVALLDGGGRVQLRPGPNPGTLRLKGSLGDLAPVAALMGSDTAGADSARMNLAISGPAWRWRVEGGADAYGLAFGGNLANRVTLATKATLDSTRLAALSGDLRVADAAFGKLSLRSLTATGGYDSTLALDLKLNIGDSVRLATQVRGTVSAARDTVRAELQQLTLDEGGRAWALERPAALGFGPRVEVNGLALRAGDRSIVVNGVLDRRGTSDLTLGITSLELETLRASGLVPVGGRLDGRLHLTGPAEDPRLQGDVSLAIESSEKRELGTVGTKLDWTGGGLRVSAAARPLRGGALTIEGSLPYRLTLAPRDTSAAVASEALEVDTVSLAVRADSFDLSLFQPLLPPDAATGLGGRLATDARVGGTIKAPRATGAVNLARVTLELPPIGVAYERGELVGQLEGDGLRIEKLRLLTGKKEELLGSGDIQLTPLNDPGLKLAGTMRDFRLVHSDQLRTSASGKVQVGGTLLHPELTGSVKLGRTDFFVGAGGAKAQVEEVELAPGELRELARDFGPGVLQQAEKPPGLMDRVKMDLAIQMPGQVWIRRTSSPKANIELMGNLRLTQQPGQEMQFFGHVEPVPDRGTLELSGRQFRLSEGDINLAGPVDSTKLDVTASYQVPTQGSGEDEGVIIDVHARGRIDSLGLEFTSEPSLSQDDILSYIVTGRPASDNPLFEGSGTGGGNTGEQVALGTLTSAISNSAGQSLGLDVFQIRQEPSRGLTLTAGRYVGPRLFLDMQLPLQLGSQARQTPGANLGPGFELEYTLRRWLRSSVRGGSLSPGLLFRARRAY
jgi:autotransporter translocation and assembly factor TamB